MSGRGIAALALACALPAYGQAPALERGPADRPTLPGFLTDKPPPFVLPPVPAVPDGRLGAPVRLVVSHFRFTGATAFAESELQQLVAPYVGRPIGNEELEEARLAVTRHYLAAGYLFSGALIPDQAVSDGIVVIQVVEGRLAAIEVGGPNNFDPEFIRGRVEQGAGPPLNVLRLQERMQLLLQNPQIERINSELGAGAQPGEAVLRMDLAEAKRRTLGVAIANNRSPAVGGTRREVNGALRNEFGRGESLALAFGEAKGLKDASARLALPVSARDTLLTVKLERTESQVVEPPFNAINVENDSEAIEVGLVHPVHKSIPREVALGATVARRKNASFLLGQPFSFVPGLADGRSVVAALRLFGDWNERSASRVLAARLTRSWGLPMFGATENNTGNPDSRFSTWLAQAQAAQRLPGNFGQLVLRGDWQSASEALLPAEKFAVGGVSSVRGYRENALVRDNGWAASVEYRKEVGRVALLPEGEGGPVEFAAFADSGAARERGGPSQQLSGVGFGLRYAPWKGALAQVYKARALNNLQTPTKTSQDAGVHFLFQLSWDF
jgi:hemolysin activation/secretion protein